MQRRWALVLGIALLIGSVRFLALQRSSAAEEKQQAGTVQAFDFATGSTDWGSLDPEAKVESVTGEGKTKVGNAALAFHYIPRKGAISVLTCQKLNIAGARSASFYLKTDQPTMLVFVLREKNDARYQTMLYNPAGEWTYHTVDFSELNLADDSKDDDNQLDVDQVDTVAFMDMEVMRAQQSETPGNPRVFYLDGLQFKTTSALTGAPGSRIIDNFETGAGAWMPMRMEKDKGVNVDGGARVTTADLTEGAKAGVKVLEYHYQVGSGAFSLLTRRLPSTALANAGGIKLKVKTSEPTVVVLGLTEKGGAKFNAPFYCPKDHYQQLLLTPSDFQLDEHSKDPGRPLDLSQVVNMDVADAAGFLALMMQKSISGERTLYLEDIEAVSAEEAKKAADPSIAWADDFRNGCIRWLPVRVTLDPMAFDLLTDGGLQIVHPQDRPDGTNALEFSYYVSAKTIVGLMHPMQRLKAGSANLLRLVARSESDTTLLVNLKENEQSEYQYRVLLQKSDGWKTVEAPLSEFKLGDGKTDPDGQLDLDQVKEIAIADVSMGQGNPGKNTLCIESISLVRK